MPAPTPAPAQDGPRTLRDVVYGTVVGVDLLLDAAFPASGDGPFPVVLCLHGGGWQKGSKSQLAGRIAELARRGYVAVSADYRLAPRWKFPAPVEDTSCAVRFLRAKAVEWKLNPNRIAAWGEAEGAYLALMLGLLSDKDGFDGVGGHLEQTRGVRSVVAFHALSDLAAWSAWNGAEPYLRQLYGKGSSGLLSDFLGTSDRKAETMARASPVTYVSAGDAAVLSVHGSNDPVVPLDQAKALHAALRRAGVDEKLFVVEGGAHGFGGAQREEAEATAYAFLERTLRGAGEKPAESAPASTPGGTPEGTPGSAPKDPAKRTDDIERDVVYRTLGPLELHLDVARPTEGSGPFPLVVAFHPGPYTPKARADLHEEIRWFAENGFVAASVEYRGPVKGAYPVPVEDGREAIRFFRRNAERFGIDAKKVAVVGANLGGWVALHLALAAPADGSGKPQAAVALYAPTDLTDKGFEDNPTVGRLREVLVGMAKPGPAALERASPLTYAGPGDPPVLLFHNPTDRAVPYGQSQRLSDALTKAGGVVKLVPLEGSGHGADRVPQTPKDVEDRKRIREGTLTFLREALGLPPPLPK